MQTRTACRDASRDHTICNTNNVDTPPANTNYPPSGPHFAQRDWQFAAENDWAGASHKGREQDGVWVADTAAMDYLTGEWRDGRRVGGAGFTLLAEDAWQTHAGHPARLRPGLLSPGRPHPGHRQRRRGRRGGLHIDAVLANNLMLRYFDTDSLQIHVPPPGVRRSDHRMLTWRFRVLMPLTFGPRQFPPGSAFPPRSSTGQSMPG
jgi:hypothetical protein